jgi:crotonobetainyl-CoA:carnitine CoA-transferase CaiB-like acyl-CoA transferase
MSNIGPAPFCGMLLADMGAEVLRGDGLGASDLGFAIEPRFDLPNRAKQAIAINVKDPAGADTVKQLIAAAIRNAPFDPRCRYRLTISDDQPVKPGARYISLPRRNTTSLRSVTGWKNASID